MLALGVTGPEVLAWLRIRLLPWVCGDGSESLSHVLHLGDSPRRFRLALRDGWLHDACVPGTSWEKARALAREVEHFLIHKWPSWRRLEAPPEYAAPVEVCLVGAALAADLPRSAVSLYRITSQSGGTAK